MIKRGNRFVNRIGQKFGRLLVIRDTEKSQNRKVLWECLCDCGNKTIVQSSNLVTGHAKSCGCLNQEMIKKRNTTHNMGKTRFYKIFAGAKDRCKNSNTPCYFRYGGRDIKCLWESFEEFMNDMYESYLQHCKEFGEENTTLDRIDNNGNYKKSNCRWATWKKQSRNTRFNHMITFNKKTYCLSEWAEKISIKPTTLFQRISKYKWPTEKALTTPVKR